ncbi:GrpB family protein [Plantactinospora sp. GCM10030261]|uniref:GrpB family protein n=1 Tax=Plantactinospora sp. GCM10030261 TaxID=3273420 RepID=UPI0036202082
MAAQDEPIHVVPYDDRWPVEFATEAQAIRAAIGPWITGGIHHVGSTAIPGLSAKPVIDIQVGVADLASSEPCIERLTQLDYCYAPHRRDVMHWFCKPDPSRRTHHLHLVPTGSARFADVLTFRDYLRVHPSARDAYENRKRELATAHPHDRQAYTDGKGDLVAELTRAAHAWQTAETGSNSAGT